ncbi:MAG TPA: ABC transporter permease [Acidimicrobiales bacterium]|nr:ABC transporter permease [Acidimicrobiales bacterium]
MTAVLDAAPPPDAGPAVAPAPAPARPRRTGRVGDLVLKVVAGLVLVYLFAPIAVIVLFSFNEPRGKFNLTWKGFTLENWAHPFKYPQLTDALVTSLHVAALSTAIALVLGTLAALALVRHRFRGDGGVDAFLVLSLTAPEVVMGASLLTMFIDFGWNRGFGTIVLAHVSFEVAFVALTVRARLRGFDWTLEDASMDLGATPLRTFRLVTLPLILPGIVAAAMLSFALSLDDFIITYFNSGSTVTYPLYVNAATKTGLPPQINVLATSILLVSLALLGLAVLWQRRFGHDRLTRSTSP